MQEPHDPNTPGAHDAPTDPATAVTPPPAPVRASLARRMARYGLWAALGLLMVLALALGGLWFWSATDESLNTLLRLVQRHMPAGSSLQVEGVSGSLRRGGHIDKLVYRLNDTGRNPENHAENAERTGENAGALTVTLENTDITWNWAALRHRATQLRHLHVRTLTIADTRAAKAKSEPTQPMKELVLPVGVDAPFTIDTLAISRADGAPQTLHDVQGRYRYEHASARHHLAIDSLRYQQGRYTAQATLGGQAPMPLQLAAEAQLAIPAQQDTAAGAGAGADTDATQTNADAADSTPPRPAHAFQIKLTGNGTLSGTEATLQLAAQATPTSEPSPQKENSQAQLDLQATIHPWRQQMLSGAQAQWQGIDLQAFAPQAPRTLLQGQLQLQAQATPTQEAASIATNTPTPSDDSTAPNDAIAQALRFLGTAHWQATLHTSNAEAGPLDQQRLPLHALNSRLHYHDGQLQLQTFDWQTAPQGGRIQGQGHYQAAQGWHSQWQLQQLDLATMHSAVQAEPLQGSIQIRSDFSDQHTLANAPVVFESTLQSLAGRDNNLLHFDTITLQGRWHEQEAQLSRILVRSRGGTLQGQARYHVGKQAAQADLSLQAPGSSGQIKGQLAADSGQGQLQLNVSNLHQTSQWLRPWPGMQFLRSRTLEGAARLHANWRGGWSNNGQNLQLQAQLQAPLLTMQQAGASNAPITVRAADLSVQGRLAHAQLRATGQMQQGSRTMQVNVNGHGGKRSNGWQAQLQALQAQLRDTLYKQNWQADLAEPVPITMTQNSKRLQVRTGAFHIRLQGHTAAATNTTGNSAQAASIQGEPLHWVQQGNSYQISSKGSIRGLPLAWIEALAASATLDQSLASNMLLDGAWNVELGQRLQLQAHLARSSGDIVILSGQGGRVAAGIRNARIDVQSNGNQIEARLLWDSARAGNANAQVRTRLQRKASGWSLPGSAPLSGQLQAKLPRVGVWNMFAPPGWRLRGTLDTQIALSGTLQSPQLHGTLNMDDLGVRSIVDGIAFSGGRLRARLNGQRMDISEFSMQGSPARTGLLGTQRIDGGSINITGYTQWGGGADLLDSIRVQLTGKINQLQLFTLPDRMIALSGDINAGFTGRKLTLRSGLLVNRALIELPDSSAPTLGDDVVILPSRKQHTAAQAQTVQPSAALSTQQPSATPRSTATQAARTTANSAAPALGNDVVVLARPAATTVTSAAPAASAAAATASHPSATTAQAAATPVARQTAPRRTAAGTNTTASTSARSSAASAEAGANARPNPAIEADIQINIDLGNNFRVRGRGLDTHLNGKLGVVGGPGISDMPRLTGVIHTDRGTFRAYGQDLEIERGRIIFTGAAANPQLDIVALRSNLDIRVGVRIYGTAQQPTVQLFSDPAMPDSERLSWLVLGRSSDSAADAALLQQAAMALLGGDSRSITGSLADALGLDDVNFKGGDSLSTSSVTLGKRFGKNFYVTYEKGLDATMGTLYFFFDISRKLKLRAQTGQQSALDLIYTVNYD